MTDWGAQSAATVLKDLKSSEKGLSSAEAAKRLKQFGYNEIKGGENVKWYKILLSQFVNIMVLVLIGALVVSIIAKEELDAIAIGIIIVLNAVIGFLQEYKAEKAIEALRKMTAPYALVRRNNEIHKIPARELVPGDILILEEGTQVPTDARLLESNQLYTIEASLTGESQPTEKTVDVLKKVSSLGDLKNCVFMGTVISQGHGVAIVVETGMNTEFGKIAHMVQSQHNEATPLQKQLDRLSKILALLVVGVAILMFLLALLTKRDLVEMLLLSISLAVSVIPEGLPAVITLTLAMGVQQIAKKNAIIRKLAAAETLGSVSTICTDKTGTLTQNQMTVKVLWINGRQVDIPGIGYEPKEQFPIDSDELELLLRTGALCNNSALIQSGENWGISGDPTEGALLTLARKGSLNPDALNKKFPRTKELIFDSVRKRMSTLNKGVLYTKGAPDTILEVCSHIQIEGKISKLSTAQKKLLHKEIEKLASRAFRVLGFAYKITNEAAEENMVFLGLAALIDPPRAEVKEAIQICKNAHIRTVMITGDHALTAMAIGKEIGLFQEGDLVITGAELEKMTFRKLCSIVEKVSIYARVNPADKVKILRALKEKGHTVSMTGDGVNDAPALKQADIGVAMGITGTDVSKEASDMILMDDNFATIVATVEIGRTIYRNIKKFVRFLLSANFSAVILVCVTFLLNVPIPFLPLQILWVNLLTDAFPALALGMDTPEDDIMTLKPRDPKQSIFKDLLSFSILAGILSSATSLYLYFSHLEEYSIEHTRTLVFTSIVVFELLLVFAIRYKDKHYFTGFFKNKLLLVSVFFSLGLQVLGIYLPFFQTVLETHPLSVRDWLEIGGLSAACMVIIEIWKRFQPKSTTV
ncbi:MAG: cation-translocating P-type ATPase [Patescibacteria group bacterium]